jgi:multiple sugar transport system ATP-binding protein
MGRLTLTDLHKHYGDTHAVKGVSLDIPEGEFAVLVGPSGCGKSTLLRSIAGLENIDQGTIAIDGEAVNDMRPRDRNIAMVFQNYALYPYMNVYDNISFGLRARNIAETEVEKRVRQAAEMLDIAPLLNRLPRQLSGGQRQRVAIGRAIVRDARLFLFDEPLSNLDAKLRDEMRAEIKRLHQELGKTMIYVTHDQVEAMTLADRIVLLRDGVIEQEGAPLDLFERPKTRFVAGFLGSPSMNFIPARLGGEEGGLEVTIDGVGLPLPAARAERLKEHRGKEVVFGVRPEHLTRARDGETRLGLVRLSVTFDLIQPTGSRSYGSFKLGGVEVTAELQAHDAEQPGERLDLHVDMNRAVVIDPATERVL